MSVPLGFFPFFGHCNHIIIDIITLQTMAVNAAGTIYRTAEDEAEDTEQIFDNLLKESWKDWKNEAGVGDVDGHS